MDEGDYSPVDEDNTTTQNTESQTSSLIGKVQKTAEKFNNLINNQKLSKSSATSTVNDKEITSNSIDSEMSSNLQNGKNLKDLINDRSSMDNVGDSGIGQLSSNSLSGTSVSGSISSSNSSSSTSPQDSHNDSGYSTRVGYSAGPSPSLSGIIIFQMLYYFLNQYLISPKMFNKIYHF